MQRRTWIAAAGAWPLAAGWPALAWAHHGWSSFDLNRPIYLEGKARRVAWRNPHAELDLELAADLKLPADLGSRPAPAQTASVDGPRVLGTARLPSRKDRTWRVELAPLTRMESWRVPPIQDGDTVAVVGFTFEGERGDAILRAEYLILGGRMFGLRSSPA
jgi:hypothetical protein